MSSVTSSLVCARLTGFDIDGGDGYLLMGRVGGASLVPLGYVVVFTPLYLLQCRNTVGTSDGFESKYLIQNKTITIRYLQIQLFIYIHSVRDAL